MPSDSIGVSALEPELIVDKRGGAIVIKFAEMTDAELLKLFWSFPEARLEYFKRLSKKPLLPNSR